MSLKKKKPKKMRSRRTSRSSSKNESPQVTRRSSRLREKSKKRGRDSGKSQTERVDVIGSSSLPKNNYSISRSVSPDASPILRRKKKVTAKEPLVKKTKEDQDLAPTFIFALEMADTPEEKLKALAHALKKISTQSLGSIDTSKIISELSLLADQAVENYSEDIDAPDDGILSGDYDSFEKVEEGFGSMDEEKGKEAAEDDEVLTTDHAISYQSNLLVNKIRDLLNNQHQFLPHESIDTLQSLIDGIDETFMGTKIERILQPEIEEYRKYKPKGKKSEWLIRSKQNGPVTIKTEKVRWLGQEVVRPLRVTGVIVPTKSNRGSTPSAIVGFPISLDQANANKAATVHKKRTREDVRMEEVQTGGRNVRHIGLPDVQKGHVMALQLGGPNIKENIVPQFAQWQANGVWSKMENRVKKIAKETAPPIQVIFDAKINYPEVEVVSQANLRKIGFPTGFEVTLTYRNTETKEIDNKKTMIVFDEEQRQNGTDEKIALRIFQEANEGSDIFDFYPDWNPIGKKVKGKKGKPDTFKGDPAKGYSNQDLLSFFN